MGKRLSCIMFFLTVQAATTFSLDPFIYTVDLKNFDTMIYRQNTSRYRLVSSDPEFSVITNRHQSVISRRLIDGKRIVAVAAGVTKTVRERLDNPEEYLRDTRFLNLGSPEITGAAVRLVKKKDPVRAVEDFVYGHITEKTYGLPLVPASQVYRIKRGDCTEHSVLAVALLRKLGVPARAIVGMYLSDEFLDKKNVFVYHMWAEAYWNGSWRLVDATRPGGAHLNRYIALAEHTLRAETPLPYLRAISAIQDLTVEYLGR